MKFFFYFMFFFIRNVFYCKDCQTKDNVKAKEIMIVEYVEEKTLFLLFSNFINGYFLICMSISNEQDMFFQKLNVLSLIIAPVILISNFYVLYVMLTFTVLSFFETIGRRIIVSKYEPSKYILKKILCSFILESFMLVYIFVKEKKASAFMDVKECFDIKNEDDDLNDESIFDIIEI